MSFKGGVLYLDLTGVTLTGSKVTVAGIYETIMRAKGKPIYVYAYTGTEYGEGFASIVWQDYIELNLAFYDVTNDVSVRVCFVIDNEDGVDPNVTTYTPDSE